MRSHLFDYSIKNCEHFLLLQDLHLDRFNLHLSFLLSKRCFLSFNEIVSFDIGKNLIAIAVFINAIVFNDDEFNASQMTYT